MPLLVALSGWRGEAGRVPGQRPLRALSLGFAAGLVYFVGTTYWTSSVLATFGGLPLALAILAMLLLAAYLALFPALGAVVTARMVNRAGLLGLFFAVPAWVATEFLRGLLFGGFPWVPLGNSQVTVLPVAQLASVLGVYGVSALVALVNASLAVALVGAGRARRNALVAAAVPVFAVGVWGAWRIADGRLLREGTPIRVGLIQGNIEQSDKWDPGQARRIFTTYLALTRDAVGRGAEYVIWPESATPFSFEADPVGQLALRELAREVRVPILFGSDQMVPGDPPRHYNAAFLLDAHGRTAAVYRKIHLVPFGEFVPFAEWLSFFPPLVQTLAGFAPFTPGDAIVMLPVGDRLSSTAICYEVVYPSLVRKAVLAGSQLLTTITNDAWYGRSSAPFQHFELAAMRAIEHGRYLARAANTGISGVVDPYGRVVQRSSIFEEAALVAEAQFLAGRTIYTAIGDVAAYAAIAIVLAGLVTAGRR